MGNGTTQSTGQGESGVQVDTGRVGRDRVLGGLLQVLNSVVSLILQTGGGLLGLGGSIVNLVSDGGNDKVRGGGSEEGVGGDHFEWCVVRKVQEDCAGQRIRATTSTMISFDNRIASHKLGWAEPASFQKKRVTSERIPEAGVRGSSLAEKARIPDTAAVVRRRG